MRKVGFEPAHMDSGSCTFAKKVKGSFDFTQLIAWALRSRIKFHHQLSSLQSHSRKHHIYTFHRLFQLPFHRLAIFNSSLQILHRNFAGVCKPGILSELQFLHARIHNSCTSTSQPCLF